MWVSALLLFARQLPIFVLLVVAAGWVQARLAPSRRELGVIAEQSRQLRLRQHAAHYAKTHWGLDIQDPRVDMAILTSAQWAAPTTWLSMEHYTVAARASRNGGRHDIYRFDVSATPAGVPVRFGFLRRLTSTDEVDERTLAARGSRVAFSLYQGGRYDSLVVLDFAGEPVELTATWPRTLRWLNALTNLQKVGQLRGVERAQYLLGYPPNELALSFTDDHTLQMGMGALGMDTVDLTSPDEVLEVEGFHVRRMTKIRDPALYMTVDLVRDLPFIGPERMAVVQRVAFDLLEAIRRQEYAFFGDDDDAELDVAGTAPARPLPEDPRDGFGVLLGEEVRRSRLPLPPVEPVLDRTRGDECQWRPVEETVPPTPDGVPLFYQSYVRIDSERPWAQIHMVVWDPDRLKLGIVAGTEEPIPTTSALGTGRIPREPGVLERLVGGFNGGFQTVHGSHGMIAERSVLVPPEDRLATVATFDGGIAALGRWSGEWVVPPSLIGMRQNLRPLVEDGQLNPDRLGRWGWALGQTRYSVGSPLTTRTGLCRLPNGAMAYMYGLEIDGTSLGRAMLALGCDFGIHLDMNPGHTGFEFYTVRDAEGEDFEARTMLQGSDMRLNRHPRYIRTDNRDFLYLPLPHNPLGETLPPACEGEAPIPYRRLTHNGEPLDPERALLLAPPRAVRLVDRPLCGQADATVEVIRLLGMQLLARVSFYREAPDVETLRADAAAIMIPVATVEAPRQVGVGAYGTLSLEGENAESVPAFAFADRPAQADGVDGVVLGVGEDDDLYLVASDDEAALTATVARLGLLGAYWLPGQEAPPELLFDNGRVQTLPADRERTAPTGFVLRLSLPEDTTSYSRRLDEMVAAGGGTP